MNHQIAMWSGPRNISTAMMRAWESRSDTVVTDEPLYAHYLLRTGLDHPGAREVIDHHETDCHRVIANLTGPVPNGKSIHYQKHMAHHLLPEIDRSWLETLTNCFLIRDPREMLTSLIKVTPHPTIEDTGLPQQVEIFEVVKRTTRKTPPVLDSRDVLDDPRKRLDALCEAIGVPFEEAMLTWEPGPRCSDGIWAKHWYGSVEQSTGFKSYAPKKEPVPDRLTDLYDQCLPLYELLYQHRIR